MGSRSRRMVLKAISENNDNVQNVQSFSRSSVDESYYNNSVINNTNLSGGDLFTLDENMIILDENLQPLITSSFIENNYSQFPTYHG